jgi:hypothetical protein
MVLDIGMSELDGAATLPKIFAVDDNAKILLVSTLSFRNVKVGVEVLLAGAADFVSLPSPSRRLRKISIDHALRDELAVKVKTLGLAHRRLRRGRSAAVAARRSYVLNKAKAVRPNVLAIGGSTDGPKVLLQLLGRLPATIRRFTFAGQPSILCFPASPRFLPPFAGRGSDRHGRGWGEGLPSHCRGWRRRHRPGRGRQRRLGNAGSGGDGGTLPCRPAGKRDRAVHERVRDPKLNADSNFPTICSR